MHWHAASRAVETEQPDAFIRDPLAAILAGPEALARRKAYDVSPSQGTDKQQQPQLASATESSATKEACSAPERLEDVHRGKMQRPVPRIIMRTRFMDDATLVGVRVQPSAEAKGAFAPTLDHLETAGASACKQVNTDLIRFDHVKNLVRPLP